MFTLLIIMQNTLGTAITSRIAQFDTKFDADKAYTTLTGLGSLYICSVTKLY